MGRMLPWMDVAYRRWSVWDLMTRLESVNLHPDDLSVFEFNTKGGMIPRALPCPYCNDLHELGSLCSHLGQDHVYESTYASCPICDWNHKKMLYHIVVVHGNLLNIKRRDYLQYFHRIRASAMNRSNPLAAMSKNNISPALGNSSNQSNVVHTPTHSSRCEEEEEEPRAEKPSGTDASLTPEERENRQSRAEFVQGLVISSFLED